MNEMTWNKPRANPGDGSTRAVWVPPDHQGTYTCPGTEMEGL